MKWAVRLLQDNLSIPRFAWTPPTKAIDSRHLRQYRSKACRSSTRGCRRPHRKSYLAAEYDAIVFALCSKSGVPAGQRREQGLLQEMWSGACPLGMDPEKLVRSLFLVIKGLQIKQLVDWSSTDVLRDGP
jgi:hypothetical protein